MGFLEKIFGRKKEEETLPEKPEKIKLDLDKAEAWFDDEMSGFIKTINADADSLVKQIKNVSENLEESLQKLETKESEDELEGRMKMLAIGNKESFIKKVRLFNSISPPEPKDTLLFSDFCTKVISDINRMTKKTSKNIYFAKMQFGEEINDITASLNSMASLIHEFQKKQDMRRINRITEVRNLLKEIKSLSETQKEGNRNLEQKIENLKTSEDEKNKAKKNLENVEASEESSRLKQMIEQKGNLNDEISINRNNIILIFSPLAKVLKKYERFDTSLSADDAKILAEYIKSPFRALKIDTEFLTLDKITEETEKLITSGKIDLKDRQKEKALARISSLKDHSLLNKHLSEHSRLKEQLNDLEIRIKATKINRETETARQKLKDLEDRTEKEEQDIQKIKNTQKNTDETISLKTKDLETALTRISGKDISFKA
ncbi:MAG: hypothetical protein U9O53_06525 [archaeon]|nr:hypothetical protein [archaeon]